MLSRRARVHVSTNFFTSLESAFFNFTLPNAFCLRANQRVLSVANRRWLDSFHPPNLHGVVLVVGSYSSSTKRASSLNIPPRFPRVCNRSFFGLTALGQGNVFENAKANKLERLTSVPVEEFLNAFAEMSLEQTNPALAEEIRVDGKMFMAGREAHVMKFQCGLIPEPLPSVETFIC